MVVPEQLVGRAALGGSQGLGSADPALAGQEVAAPRGRAPLSLLLRLTTCHTKPRPSLSSASRVSSSTIRGLLPPGTQPASRRPDDAHMFDVVVGLTKLELEQPLGSRVAGAPLALAALALQQAAAVVALAARGGVLSEASSHQRAMAVQDSSKEVSQHPRPAEHYGTPTACPPHCLPVCLAGALRPAWVMMMVGLGQAPCCTARSEPGVLLLASRSRDACTWGRSLCGGRTGPSGPHAAAGRQAHASVSSHGG